MRRSWPLLRIRVCNLQINYFAGELKILPIFIPAGIFLFLGSFLFFSRKKAITGICKIREIKRAFCTNTPTPTPLNYRHGRMTGKGRDNRGGKREKKEKKSRDP